MTTVLDVALGVFSLYSLLALIVTALQELLARALQLRAKHLFGALEGALVGQPPPAPAGAARVHPQRRLRHRAARRAAPGARSQLTLEQVETWLNDCMARASASYKR